MQNAANNSAEIDSGCCVYPFGARAVGVHHNTWKALESNRPESPQDGGEHNCGAVASWAGPVVCEFETFATQHGGGRSAAEPSISALGQPVGHHEIEVLEWVRGAQRNASIGYRWEGRAEFAVGLLGHYPYFVCKKD